MPLLSNRADFDRQATKRAECGILSQRQPLTIEEVCEIADYPMPVTEADLKAFAGFCEMWGIATNIDDVSYFATYRQETAL